MQYVASKSLYSGFKTDLSSRFTKEVAEIALDELEAKWGNAYPLDINAWRRKWDNLSPAFKYRKC